MSANIFKDFKLPVCLLIIMFGMGSWVAVNGMWVELPILVHQLPESWNLPSYMTIIIQVANIGPLIYTIGHLLLPRIITEKPVAYFIIFTGCVAAILIAFVWQETVFIGGTEHGLYFFVLLFWLSVTDCTSSVVFLPFMNNFKPQYMTSYYIGGGFSGLVPSIVSFAQGVGKTKCVNTSLNDGSNGTEYGMQEMYVPPVFPARDFFLFIFAMMVLCAIAFMSLNYLPYCKKEYVLESRNDEENKKPYDIKKEAVTSFEGDGLIEKEGYVTEDAKEKMNEFNLTERDCIVQSSQPVMSTAIYLLYLFFIGWINAMTNGVLMAVQSYACLPYGDQTYHLTVTLCNIANPVGCFLAFFMVVKSAVAISVLTMVGSFISAYILVIASYSPEPPLIDSIAGPIMIVSIFSEKGAYKTLPQNPDFEQLEKEAF